MPVRSYGRSDVGRRREHNEDSYLADDELGLYVVADGVGGQAKGEVASAQSVEEVHGFIKRENAKLATLLTDPGKEDLFAARRIVESAMQSACYMVFGLAELDPHHRGMSTTMTTFVAKEHIGIVGQVGDSRIYRLREGHAEQLTEDHTLLNYKIKHGLIDPEDAAAEVGKKRDHSRRGAP